MAFTSSFLPTRDLCNLKCLDLSEPSCLERIKIGLEHIASLLGLSNGEIYHTFPRPCQRVDSDFTEAFHVSAENEGIDAFERQYVTRWLTRLVSEFSMAGGNGDNGETHDRVDAMAERCSELLSASAGKMAAGDSVKDHILPLSHQGESIRIRLRDAALVHDSLGTHTWGAAPILAQLLLPLAHPPDMGCRILELGAGTGLVGLALATWSCQHRSLSQTEIICTDYHPSVLANLAYNVELNLPLYEPSDERPHRVDLRAAMLDWQSIHRQRARLPPSGVQILSSQTLPEVPLNSDFSSQSERRPWSEVVQDDYQGTFDLIIAADCVYDPVHPIWIRSVAETFLRRKRIASHKAALLHVMVPLRPTHRVEVEAVYKAFGVAAGGSPSLRIISESDFEGYENFGMYNRGRSLGQDGGAASGGLARIYRWFVIGWSDDEHLSNAPS